MHRSRPRVGFGLECILLTAITGGGHSGCDGAEVEQHLPALKKYQGRKQRGRELRRRCRDGEMDRDAMMQGKTA
jgi:hypothetical protein